MFWGIVLKANKKYSQKTTKSFHVSQAALDPSSSTGGSNQVFVSYENNKYLVCVLENGKCQQVPLDLNFAAGEEISFQSLGNGCVHLSGYLTDIPEDFDLSDNEEEESETEVSNEILTNSKKNGNKEKPKPKKGAEKAIVKAAAEDDDSDMDEMDISGLGDDDDDSDDSDDEEVDEEDDEDEEDSGEASDEEVQQPKPKQIKFDKHVNKQQNGVSEKAEITKKEKNKKVKKQNENTQKQQNSAGEKNLSGGVKVQDIVIGTGPEVKSGKKVQVYYEGRLKQNNKVFDSVKQGAGFKFTVGKGEVIKGWDIGVAGMKVGGKRRITCPPHMAYGARGMPPQIPPNSTLVFEVELKGV